MLGKETHQLVTRTIICDESRLRVHIGEHDVEKTFAIATTLDLGINIEIEDGQRFHFVHLATASPHKKLLIADFDEANSLVALSLDEQNVLIRLQLA